MTLRHSTRVNVLGYIHNSQLLRISSGHFQTALPAFGHTVSHLHKLLTRWEEENRCCNQSERRWSLQRTEIHQLNPQHSLLHVHFQSLWKYWEDYNTLWFRLELLVSVPGGAAWPTPPAQQTPRSTLRANKHTCV